MAKKLDVSQVAENMRTRNEVRGSMEKGKDDRFKQPTAGPDEQAERLATMRTQGKKGCSAPRFNFRTTPKHKKYVEVMAKVTGQSVAGFMNELIARSLKENQEVYDQAVEVMIAAGMIKDDEV